MSAGDAQPHPVCLCLHKNTQYSKKVTVPLSLSAQWEKSQAPFHTPSIAGMQ
jgi:hypothetical protein